MGGIDGFSLLSFFLGEERFEVDHLACRLKASVLKIFIDFFSGFHPHLQGIPSSQAAHLAGHADWRVLNNRPFPSTQYFQHHPHFAAHNMLTAAIDRMDRTFTSSSSSSSAVNESMSMIST